MLLLAACADESVEIPVSLDGCVRESVEQSAFEDEPGTRSELFGAGEQWLHMWMELGENWWSWHAEYDANDCLVAWTSGSGGPDYDAPGSEYRAEGSAVCDDHGYETESRSVSTQTYPGREPYESAHAETFTNTYDARNLLIARTEIDVWTGSYDSTQAYAYTFTYDDQDRLVREERLEDGETLTTWTWTYDERGVVVEETHDDETGTHTYDAMDRVVRTEWVGGDGAPTATSTWTYEGDWPWPATEKAESHTSTDYGWSSTMTYRCGP